MLLYQIISSVGVSALLQNIDLTLRGFQFSHQHGKYLKEKKLFIICFHFISIKEKSRCQAYLISHLKQIFRRKKNYFTTVVLKTDVKYTYFTSVFKFQSSSITIVEVDLMQKFKISHQPQSDVKGCGLTTSYHLTSVAN